MSRIITVATRRRLARGARRSLSAYQYFLAAHDDQRAWTTLMAARLELGKLIELEKERRNPQ